MGVNRNLVVCLVVALLYSSLTPVSDPPIDNAKKQPLSYTDSALDLAMKIQLPDLNGKIIQLSSGLLLILKKID